MQKKQYDDQIIRNDPYQLIRTLNKKLKAQSESINWYKKTLQTSEYQKKITINQLKKKKETLEVIKIQLNQQKQHKKDSLFELQQLKVKINKIQKLGLSKTTNLKPNYFYSPSSLNTSKNLLTSNIRIMQKPLSSMASLQLKKTQYISVLNPMNRMIQQKKQNIEDYIPADVKFFQKTHKSSFFANSSGSFLNMSGDFINQSIPDQPISQNPAQFFFQDFLILGPDVSQLKRKRDQNRKKIEHQIKPAVLYTGNCKNPSQLAYTQIASRCFPFNIITKRQMIENYEDLNDIIQFCPSNKLSNDCLIFNLKGQVSNSAKNNQCFKRSNLNQIQFIFCLKVPDFIWISKDEKNYQRTEQQVWLVQKYYAIATYYPFFDIHLNILLEIHKALMKQKLEKILIQKQKFYQFDLRKNILDLQKNEYVKSIINNFKQHQVQFNQVIYFQKHYYGTIPRQGFDSQYYISKMTAPIFMTNFSFQQMLLLLTGLFCQKSIIFLSKNQGIATLCALFLISMITPFPYTSFIMLNTDQQKVGPIIFQYPFPMVATIKKTQQNLNKILFLYASARIQKKDIKQQAERIILVDIDTNSIFYQGGVNFQSLIFNPGESIMQQYQKVNGCFSKSFSFPKKMDAKLQPKKRQERVKIMEDMERTIASNISKSVTYQSNKQIQKVLFLLIEYMKSFGLQGIALIECLGQLKSNKYHGVVKRHLLQKHGNKSQLLDKIINSQFYADYLNLYSSYYQQ